MMRQIVMWLLAAAATVLIHSFATGIDFGADPVKASLVLPADSVALGQPFIAGIFLKIDPHWHVYWKSSGDAGLPTRVAWRLPDGWTASDLEWPLPEKFIEKGPMITYGYADSVMLLARITPAKSAPGVVNLSAQIDWMVCEETCIPGNAKVSQSVTVVTPPPPTVKLPEQAARISRWQAKVPNGAGSVSWDVSTKSRPHPDEKNALAVELQILGVQGLELLDWYPVAAKNRTIKNIKVSGGAGELSVSFALKSFSGLIGAGERLESLVIYRDAHGVRRGATVVINLDPA